MREAARRLRDSVIASGRGGTHQAREERDVIVRSSLARLEQLRLGGQSLCFGRIDRTNGERFYIGRLAVSDESQEPLIVDWRAPVAEAFYRATGRHPMGLVRRRHLHTEGPRITGIEDEVFDLDAAAADPSTLAGEAALLAAVDRSRSGTMRDIVATIQAEQDEIIRAPMPGVLVLQGGPGTGKTAVALHRAAYLLYTHRFPLERQGVLVIGPNPLFLRYIEQVMPSLGETGVTLSTIGGLVTGAPGEGTGRGWGARLGEDGPAGPGEAAWPIGVRARAAERPEVALVKGDARMAAVLARAVADRQRPLTRNAVVPFGAFSLRLSVDDSARIVAAAKRRPGPHNLRRAFVLNEVVGVLHAAYDAATTRARRAGLREREADEEIGREEFAEVARALPQVREALDRMWPVLLPQELLHDLFGAPALVELAARRHLGPDERALLHRPRSTALAAIPWTEADLPLLDEAAVLLGPRRRRESSDNGPPTFGHIVVDEAQDLSPMQLRMLKRRSLSGSMTVVGDIAQSTGAWAPAAWEEVLRHLPSRRPGKLTGLSVNYRTPVEIMDVAARILAVTAPQMHPPRSVRSAGVAPVTRPAAPGRLVDEALAAAAELREEVGGIVAVVCPDSMAGRFAAALGTDGSISLDDPVSVVPVGTVKGLEFDGVVVVEPAAIVGEATQGLRALYVAVTRATKRLAFVHEQPLPPVLGLT